MPFGWPPFQFTASGLDFITAVLADFTSLIAIEIDGVAQVSTDGLVLRNTTAATVLQQVQIGPRLRFLGHVWSTSLGGSDQTSEFWIESVPSGNIATPFAFLNFMYSANGGAAVAAFKVSSQGNLTVAGELDIAAAQFMGWVGRSFMNSPADGQLNLVTNAGTVGVGFNFGTDSVLKVRNRAQSAYATVDALGYSVGGVAGASKGAGAVTSITVVNGIVTAIS